MRPRSAQRTPRDPVPAPDSTERTNRIDQTGSETPGQIDRSERPTRYQHPHYGDFHCLTTEHWQRRIEAPGDTAGKIVRYAVTETRQQGRGQRHDDRGLAPFRGSRFLGSAISISLGYCDQRVSSPSSSSVRRELRTEGSAGCSEIRSMRHQQMTKRCGNNCACEVLLGIGFARAPIENFKERNENDLRSRGTFTWRLDSAHQWARPRPTQP